MRIHTFKSLRGFFRLNGVLMFSMTRAHTIENLSTTTVGEDLRGLVLANFVEDDAVCGHSFYLNDILVS